MNDPIDVLGDTMAGSLHDVLREIISSINSLDLRSGGIVALAIIRRSQAFDTNDTNAFIRSIVHELPQKSSLSSSTSWLFCGLISHLVLLPETKPTTITKDTLSLVFDNLFLPFISNPATNNPSHKDKMSQLSHTCVEIIRHTSQWALAMHIIERLMNDEDDTITPGSVQLVAKLIDACVSTQASSTNRLHNDCDTIMNETIVNDSIATITSEQAVLLHYASDTIFLKAFHLLIAHSTNKIVDKTTSNMKEKEERTKKNNRKSSSRGDENNEWHNKNAAVLIQVLVPATLKAAQCINKLADCLLKIWHICKELCLSKNDDETELGLALLVQFCPFLIEHEIIAYENKQNTNTDSAADTTIWSLLFYSMTQDNELNNKRALYNLELLLNHHEQKKSAQSTDECGDLTSIAAWRAFIKLYTSTNELSIRVLLENLHDMDLIHPSSTKINNHNTNNTTNNNNDDNNDDNRTATVHVPIPWLLLLWKHLFFHRHFNARKRIVLCFFQRKWSCHLLTQFPLEFISECILPALSHSSMQRGEHSQTICSETKRFFYEWALALQNTPEKQLEMFNVVLDRVKTQKQQLDILFAAIILQEIANCAAACTNDLHYDPNKNKQQWDEEMKIVLLQNIISAAKVQPGFGANGLAIKIYQHLLHVAMSCIPEIDSKNILHHIGIFLSVMPLPLIQPGGPLYADLVDWAKRSQQQQHIALFIKEMLDDGLHPYISENKTENKTENKSENENSAKSMTQESSSNTIYILGCIIHVFSSSLWSTPTLKNEEKKELFWSALEPLHQAMISMYTDECIAVVGDAFVIPLLLQFVHVTTLLTEGTQSTDPPGESVVQTVLSTSPLYEWLVEMSTQKESFSFFLLEYAKKYSTLLLDLATPSSCYSLAQDLKKKCISLNTSIPDSMDTDDVLPVEFLSIRRDACNIIELIAGISIKIACDGEGKKEFGDFLLHFMISAAQSILDISEQSSFIEIVEVEEKEEEKLLLKRTQMEIEMAFYRPFIACCQSFASEKQHPTIFSSLLLQLDTNDDENKGEKRVIFDFFSYLSSSLMPKHLPFSSSSSSLYEYIQQHQTDASQNKKSRKSSKLPAITLNGWHHLLSWRVVDSLMVLVDIEKSDKIQLLTAAILSLSASEKGNTAVLYYIRCIRTLLPLLAGSSGKNQEEMIAFMAEHFGKGTLKTINSIILTLEKVLLYWLSYQARKKTGFTAAIISTCLHPCLFTPELVMLHIKGGAVHSIIKQMLDEKIHSQRILTLTATQLSALLASVPILGAGYADILIDMSLLSVEEVNNTTLGFPSMVVDEPSAIEIASLMKPLDPHLASIYESTSVASRIPILCLFHSWIQASINNHDVDAEIAATTVRNALFHLAITDDELCSKNYIYFGPTHKKKVRAWQALTVLCPGIVVDTAISSNNNNNNDDDNKVRLETLLGLLDLANASTVKQYQEILTLYEIMKHNQYYDDYILPLLRDYSQQRNEQLPSIIMIAAHFVVQQYKNDKNRILQLIESLVPWIGSFKSHSRTFSQIVLWRFFELYPFLLEENTSYLSLYTFFQTNADLSRLRSAMGVESGLDQFNMNLSTSPRSVLCINSTLIGANNMTFEGCEPGLVECIQQYLAQEKALMREFVAVTKAESLASDQKRSMDAMTKEENALLCETGSLASENVQKNNNWQKKIIPSDIESKIINPFDAVLSLSSLSISSFKNMSQQQQGDVFESEMLRYTQNEAILTRNQAGIHQDLIVVASLIDRIPNLAGLTRTCEIFRASKLVLSDISITKSPEFTAISVSSEHWMNLEQVSKSQLHAWLQYKSIVEGYTLVGLEQTSESVSLPEYSFPRKAILVLGSEREGIRADILGLLNSTVEIPQFGMIRSLNVHVSSAIAIYEYTRQGLVPSHTYNCEYMS